VEIRSAEFRPDFAHRGLLIDKAAGTVAKMDRHFYVGRAYLGRRLLTSAERMDLYRRERVDLRRSRFYHVDTLFELAEVNLFSELVELVQQGAIPGDPRIFEKIFEDVRHAVDGVHGDGTLKSRIIENLPSLLPHDADLPLTIKKLALTGRRLLLISNSEWYYTDAVCRYLFGESAPDRDWQKLFDLIVVSARKPLFFRDQSPFSAIDDEGKPSVDPSWQVGTYGDRLPGPFPASTRPGGAGEGRARGAGQPARPRPRGRTLSPGRGSGGPRRGRAARPARPRSGCGSGCSAAPGGCRG